MSVNRVSMNTKAVTKHTFDLLAMDPDVALDILSTTGAGGTFPWRGTNLTEAAAAVRAR